MVCYISRNYKGLDSAGNKAKTDIEQIMGKLHFKNVGLKQTTYKNSIISYFLILFGVLKCGFCLRKGDILVLQYPLKKYYSFVCSVAHLRGSKVVTLIHDLGSFRRGRLTIEKEIARLNHSDYIIAHNQVMQSWLKENGYKSEVGVLEIFDFLSTSGTQSESLKKKNPCRVVYAGALNRRKNNFLYEVGKFIHSYKLVLYGAGFEEQEAEGKQKFDYKGFTSSEKLIENVGGEFGLVWDGNSTSTCAGNWGEYLQYNNPHKTSLYIRCGVPVIIWEKAALATFVSQHNIGICIASMEDLDHILSTLTAEQYADMKKNVGQISKRLSEGYYFSKAIAIATSFLEGKNQ